MPSTTTPTTRILMVCLGNICRSPLAHGILESKLPLGVYDVDSAGTSNYHIGEAPDYRSIKVAKNHGIDLSQQRGRQFTSKDFEDFDIIYAMDDSNYQNIIALATSNTHRNKVKRILDENPSLEYKTVPDPYYGDVSDFEHVYQLLEDTCSIIANNLIQKK